MSMALRTTAFRTLNVNKTAYLTPTSKASPSPVQWSHQVQPCASEFPLKSRNTNRIRPLAADNSDAPLALEVSTMTSLCPLDGDIWDNVKELSHFVSEFAFIKFKVLIVIRWLLKLSQIPEVDNVPKLSFESECFLLSMIDQFGIEDAIEVKKLEKVTDDGLRAIESFLVERCKSNHEISKVSSFFGFGCGLKDVEDLAHSLMLKEAVNKVMLPSMGNLITTTPLLLLRPLHGIRLGWKMDMLTKGRGELSNTDNLTLSRSSADLLDTLVALCMFSLQ